MTQDPRLPGKSKRRAIIAVAAVAMVAYVGAGFAVDASRVREAIEGLGWIGCSLVLSLSVLNYLVRFQRWQMFLARLGHRLPGVQHLLCYLSGFAFTVSPAKAGEAVRSIYLYGYGVSYSESVAALFVERLQDLLAMTLLASLVVLERPAYRPLIVGALLLVLALVSRRASSRCRRCSSASARIPAEDRRRLAALANLLRSSRTLLQPKPLLIWHRRRGGVLGRRGTRLLPDLPGAGRAREPAARAIGIYALAVLAGSAAFFLPAGIGGMEVVMTSLLVVRARRCGLRSSRRCCAAWRRYGSLF